MGFAYNWHGIKQAKEYLASQGKLKFAFQYFNPNSMELVRYAQHLLENRENVFVFPENNNESLLKQFITATWQAIVMIVLLFLSIFVASQILAIFKDFFKSNNCN